MQVCDISSMQSISAFVTEFNASGSPLHVLVNNAGVLVSASSAAHVRILCR